MPTRGDVWMVDLGMAQKVRPGLVLNRAFKDTDRALITVIPTSLRSGVPHSKFASTRLS